MASVVGAGVVGLGVGAGVPELEGSSVGAYEGAPPHPCKTRANSKHKQITNSFFMLISPFFDFTVFTNINPAKPKNITAISRN
jgi:hypothetical protein